MRRTLEHDECLERIWHLAERGIGPSVASAGADGVREGCLRELAAGGMLALGPAGSVSLTAEGQEQARRLIRCHRIAERLVYDVLGENSETSACEFEHLVETGVVDSICTLLGHPRECPHGYAIPEGDCCRRSAEVVKRRVVPLLHLDLGESARIAWVSAQGDERLHALSSLQIRPGAAVTLHQTRPSVVIEVEGASIAIDEAVAAAINVWAPEHDLQETEGGPSPAAAQGAGQHRHRHRRIFGRTP
jgi:DtxR family transcriptional regulator, Mn-dependent transcriptional regulator